MTDEKDHTFSESPSGGEPEPEPEAKAESKAEAHRSPATEPRAEPAPDRAESESPPARSRGGLRNKLRWAKRIIVLVLLILLVLLLLNWRFCRRGSGSGGRQASDGEKSMGVPAQMTPPTARQAARPPCRLRVDSKGVSHRGKALEIPAAVKACGGAKRAELTVTGDATFGTVKQLREGLEAAGVTVVRR